MNKHFLLISLAFLTNWAIAQDGPFSEDFESHETGEEPDLFILDGDFTVETEGGNKVLQLGAEPLTEGSIQLGDSLKGGGEIQARIKAQSKRRSYPRFGVGLHGLSGYRLRVVPVQKEVELVKNNEVVKTAPFEDWKSGEWFNLRLRVQQNADETWTVSGWVWPDDGEAPENPQLEFTGEAGLLQGKGSIVGTPYSGLPIQFDDVVIKPVE